MTPDEPRPAEQQLGDYWDALVGGEPVRAEGVDPELAETIRRFQALDDAPAPDPALAEQVWRQITGEPWPVDQAATARPSLPLTNGHRPLAATERLQPLASPKRRRWAIARQGAAAYRLLAIGVLAGFVAGFVGGGLGARLAMRLAGFLADSRQQGALTENGNPVGTISASGTVDLMFEGAFFGVVGGVLYVAVRAWLPASGWRRGLAYGGLLLATFGFVVMDPHNPDYRRFGSPGLNVCAFSLVYLLFGTLIGSVADWLDRRLPPAPSGRPLRAKAVVSYVALAPFGLLGLLMVVGVGVGFAGATGFVFLALVLGAPLARRQLVRPSVGWNRPGASLRPSRAAVVGYALLAAPSLVGFILTARAIAGILGTG